VDTTPGVCFLIAVASELASAARRPFIWSRGSGTAPKPDRSGSDARFRHVPQRYGRERRSKRCRRKLETSFGTSIELAAFRAVGVRRLPATGKRTLFWWDAARCLTLPAGLRTHVYAIIRDVPARHEHLMNPKPLPSRSRYWSAISPLAMIGLGQQNRVDLWNPAATECLAGRGGDCWQKPARCS